MSSTTQPAASSIGASNIMLSGAIACLAIALVLWFAQLGSSAHGAVQRSTEMAAESRALCEKWGMRAGSQKHLECLADIQAVRARHWERIVQDLDF